MKALYNRNNIMDLETRVQGYINMVSLYSLLKEWNSRGYVTRQVEIKFSERDVNNRISLLAKNAIARIVKKKYPEAVCSLSTLRNSINYNIQVLDIPVPPVIEFLKLRLDMTYISTGNFFPTWMLADKYSLRYRDNYIFSRETKLECFYSVEGIDIDSVNIIDDIISRFDIIFGSSNIKDYYNFLLAPSIEMSPLDIVRVLSFFRRNMNRNNTNTPTIFSFERFITIMYIALSGIISEPNMKNILINGRYLTILNAMYTWTGGYGRNAFQSSSCFDNILLDRFFPGEGTFVNSRTSIARVALRDYANIDYVSVLYNEMIKNVDGREDMPDNSLFKEHIKFIVHIYIFIKELYEANNKEFLFTDSHLENFISSKYYGVINE